MSQNVVRPIHVRMNLATIRRHEDGPLNTAPTVRAVLADRLQVEKGAFGRVAFFFHDDFDSDQLGFVGQHLDED